MNNTNLIDFVNEIWDNNVIPALSKFISIPARSPAYDSMWRENGFLNSAAQLFVKWAHEQNLRGLHAEIIQVENRTPLVYLEIAGDLPKTTLFYGHLDKMPESDGWDEDKFPWKPVIKNDRLYGRGSVDNGYAFFTFISAIKYLQEQKISHPRYVILIEAAEESGEDDIVFYINYLQKKIASVDFVVCLDAGCNDYERIWCCSALRGLADGVLTISVLKEGVHSGTGGGVVPCSFRILRQLLDRIENTITGEVLLKSCHMQIGAEERLKVKKLAECVGKDVYLNIPFLEGVSPVVNDVEELLLNNAFRPALCITGAEGIPSFKDAINIIRPSTAVLLSMRLPPCCDPKIASEELKNVLEREPPYGANVSFSAGALVDGWAALSVQPWLYGAMTHASHKYFGRDLVYTMDGGSIGVIALLGKKYPKAQFFVSGLASAPGANEHGPNESLYLPAAKKMTCCLAHILMQQCSGG